MAYAGHVLSEFGARQKKQQITVNTQAMNCAFQRNMQTRDCLFRVWDFGEQEPTLSLVQGSFARYNPDLSRWLMGVPKKWAKALRD